MDAPAMVPGTQQRHPWRATLRTVVQGLLGLAVLAPVLVETTGMDPDELGWLAGVLAVCGAVARTMADPRVERWITRFAPWLAAEPPAPAPPRPARRRAGRQP